MFVILAALTPYDCVGNFIALQIVSNFPNFMYGSMGGESLKRLGYEEVESRLLIVRRTTSKHCSPKEMTGVFGPDGKELPRLITWQSRHLDGKVMFLLYRSMRLFYIVYYFYFVPLFVLIYSITLPEVFGPYEILHWPLKIKIRPSA